MSEIEISRFGARKKKMITRRMQTFKEFLLKNESFYFYTIFTIALIIHFYISFIGWNNNILDQYGFRQAHTAISTYYTIKDGFKLRYLTPVLGSPWSIPLEFPLFQWIVAGIVIIFKTSLDQTGRFVSLVFFYLSIIPLFAILKIYLKKINFVLLMLSFILLNPTYLFWSRTFLIESLALFFAILFLWLAIRLLQTNKLIFYILVPIIGSLASLVKITTFIVLCIPIACFFIYSFHTENNSDYPNFKNIKKYILYGTFIFLVPLITGVIWTHFADAQKSLNPLANGFLTSADLTKWNFGTFDQKINPNIWVKIFSNALIPTKVFGTLIISGFTIPFFLVLLPLFIIFARSYRKEVIYSFIFFIAGPLIFTNLYFIHTYYFYANNFFLSFILGFFIIFFVEHSNKTKIFSLLILTPMLFFLLITSYKNAFYNSQSNNNTYLEESTNMIKKITKEDAILFIYGENWDSSFPYYAQRKAIMDWENLPLSNKKIQNSISKTGKISALIFSNGDTSINEDFIQEQIRYGNFNNVPKYQDARIRIYLSN